MTAEWVSLANAKQRKGRAGRCVVNTPAFSDLFLMSQRLGHDTDIFVPTEFSVSRPRWPSPYWFHSQVVPSLQLKTSVLFDSSDIKVQRGPISRSYLHHAVSSHWFLKLSPCRRAAITCNLFWTLFFFPQTQSVSRKVLSLVQRAQSQPAGCISVTWNYEDAAGGALLADKGSKRGHTIGAGLSSQSGLCVFWGSAQNYSLSCLERRIAALLSSAFLPFLQRYNHFSLWPCSPRLLLKTTHSTGEYLNRC